MRRPEYGETYEGGIVFLPECLTDKARIRNVVFDECNLIGPAVVIIDTDCLFVGGFNLRMPMQVDIRSIIWPAHVPQLAGVIGMTNCKFVNCTWEGISFATQDEDDVRLMIEKATIARYELELGEN